MPLDTHCTISGAVSHRPPRLSSTLLCVACISCFPFLPMCFCYSLSVSLLPTRFSVFQLEGSNASRHSLHTFITRSVKQFSFISLCLCLFSVLRSISALLLIYASTHPSAPFVSQASSSILHSSVRCLHLLLFVPPSAFLPFSQFLSFSRSQVVSVGTTECLWTHTTHPPTSSSHSSCQPSARGSPSFLSSTRTDNKTAQSCTCSPSCLQFH